MISDLSKTQTWVVGIILLPLLLLPAFPNHVGEVFTALDTAPMFYQLMVAGVISAVLGVDIYERIKGG